MNLNELFYYDETSPTCLRWKISSSRKIRAGDQAGSLQFRPDKTTRRGVTVGYNGKYTCVHRIIWELFHGPIPDACVIDHLNGNPWDNRIENLACKTQTYNQRNRKIPKNNTSGIHGITIYESENILTVKVSVRFGKGVRFSKSFSVRKYGMENALKLAQDWRELKIRELNSLGGQFTDRHIEGVE